VEELTADERKQLLASLGRLVELARQHAAASHGTMPQRARASG
jgi:hypothetical protein